MNNDAFVKNVATQLIEQIRDGTAPWQKPWRPGTSFLPFNPTNGTRYKGINVVNLLSRGYGDARWMTYRQAQTKGHQVRRGEKGTQVQYWRFDEERKIKDVTGRPVLDPNGEPRTEKVRLERPQVFIAYVFNAEQIDGVPPAPSRACAWNPLRKAEELVQAANPRLEHASGDRANYRSSTDSIHLPLKEQFPSAGDYYSTLLHELGHWTGHATRLNRNLSDPFGSIGYAREELRAEIASVIIGSELGIGYDPGQHAAYAAPWIQILEDQPFEIFRAAADGEKIHTYLQSLQQQQSVSGEEQQDDKSDVIKEHDRLVDGPAARQWLEKERPSLVAARDQAIVELRREKLQKETAEKPHRIARVRR
jgi:putative DNA primase/helicase